jgi:HK97 family phage major capsid protein
MATDRDLAAPFVPAITKTVTSVAPTAVGYADLLSMFYSLSLPHRGASGTAWLMSTATAQAMRAIVDGSGRPVMLDQPLKSAAAGDEDFGSTQPVAFASVPTMFGEPIKHFFGV